MSRMGHWIDHTPMCPKDCLIKHHELVLALSSSSMSTADLDCSIQDQVKRGWDVDSDIPDPSPDLQRPLLYLAASFSFIRVLRYLLERFQLKAAVQSASKGESALHGILGHAYHTLRTSRPDCRRKIEAVTKMLQTLTSHDPRILLVKDFNENQTPLLFAAQSFIDLEHTTTEPQRRKRIPPQENFYAGCIEAIIRTINDLYEKGSMSKEELSEALLSPDKRGCNVLHVLAQSTHEKARFMFRMVVDCLRGVTDESEVLLQKNEAGKTVVDVVREYRPQDAAVWIINKNDYEDEDLPTMVEVHPLKQDSMEQADPVVAASSMTGGPRKRASDQTPVATLQEHSDKWAAAPSNTVTVQPSLPHTQVVYYRSPAGSSHTVESSELDTTTASPTEKESVVDTPLRPLWEKQPSSSSSEERQATEQTDAFLKLIMHDNYGLDSAGQIGMLDILHQGLKRKLSQVEDAIKATDDEIEGIEELAKTENSEVEELEHRLAELKQIVSRRTAVIKGKRLKLTSLSMDEFKLRKKIKSCEDAKNDIAFKSCKKESQHDQAL